MYIYSPSRSYLFPTRATGTKERDRTRPILNHLLLPTKYQSILIFLFFYRRHFKRRRRLFSSQCNIKFKLVPIFQKVLFENLLPGKLV